MEWTLLTARALRGGLSEPKGNMKGQYDDVAPHRLDDPDARGLALHAGIVLAQTASTTSATPTPLKTIGQSGQSKPDIVPSLIVLTARGATLENQKLTLTGVTPHSIVFADRPVRSAGHMPTADVLEEWKSSDTFGKDPPNATVSVFSEDGSNVHDAVVVLKAPKLDGEQLVFD